ncbi:hypothetical protein AZ78_1826 [Lysobacter capsici AZ78]|uniref:Uncharacterized protein n=1 Tax=Lysobacter capsici AZ78 TaxID=1444315 RepID=A0A108U834_9GAMM|nr:hypothetical protein AZ78_1826 [Lysobacter capsici AZ78]
MGGPSVSHGASSLPCIVKTLPAMAGQRRFPPVLKEGPRTFRRAWEARASSSDRRITAVGDALLAAHCRGNGATGR